MTDHSGENIYDQIDLEIEAKAKGLSVTQLRMMKAVPNDLVRDIVGDAFRSNPSRPSSLSGATPSPAPKKGTGFVEATPIRPYSGQRYVEQVADHFDRLDRAERKLKGL